MSKVSAMALRNVLQQAEFVGLTHQQAADRLAETVELARDSTAYQFSGVAMRLEQLGVPVNILIGLRARLKAMPIGGDDLEAMLLSGGVDFTLDSIRQQIAANIQHPAATAEQIAISQGCLQIGIRTGFRWRKEGLTEAATVQAIAAARATIASEQLRQQVADRYNAVVAALDDGTVTTWAAARALLGAE